MPHLVAHSKISADFSEISKIVSSMLDFLRDVAVVLTFWEISPHLAARSEYPVPKRAKANASTLCICMCVQTSHVTHTYKTLVYTRTGWRRLIGCLKLQVILCKRATYYRALLRNMTYEERASYDSTPQSIEYVHVFESKCICYACVYLRVWTRMHRDSVSVQSLCTSINQYWYRNSVRV